VKKAVIAGLVLVFALGLMGPALAKGAKGVEHGAWFGGCIGRDPVASADVIAGLGLTDDQVASIQSIQQTAFDKLRNLQEAMWNVQQELRTMLWQKSPDKTAISAKREELSQLRQQMNDVMRELRDQMRNILTEEQINKLQQDRPCRQGHWGARGQNHRQNKQAEKVSGSTL